MSDGIEYLSDVVSRMEPGLRYATDANGSFAHDWARSCDPDEEWMFEPANELTVSPDPEKPGWNCDGGISSYMLPDEEAVGLATLASLRFELLECARALERLHPTHPAVLALEARAAAAARRNFTVEEV